MTTTITPLTPSVAPTRPTSPAPESDGFDRVLRGEAHRADERNDHPVRTDDRHERPDRAERRARPDRADRPARHGRASAEGERERPAADASTDVAGSPSTQPPGDAAASPPADLAAVVAPAPETPQDAVAAQGTAPAPETTAAPAGANLAEPVTATRGEWAELVSRWDNEAVVQPPASGSEPGAPADPNAGVTPGEPEVPSTAGVPVGVAASSAPRPAPPEPAAASAATPGAVTGPVGADPSAPSGEWNGHAADSLVRGTVRSTDAPGGPVGVATSSGPQAVAAPPVAAQPAVSTQPAAAPPAADPPVRPAPIPVAGQLGARLHALGGLGAGRHVLSVPLDPEHLGPVRVVAHISADAIRVDLLGTTDASREALRGALAELRRDLSAAGLNVELGLGGGQDAQPGGPGGERSGRAGQHRPDEPRAPLADRTPAATPTPTRSAARGLDVLA